MELKTLKDVCRFLENEGFAATNSTVHRHFRRGLFGKIDGKFDADAVRRYAEQNLKRQKTGKTVAIERAEEDEEKRRYERELVKEKALRERLKRKREQGRLIDRDLLEIELASRAGVLESLLKSEFSKRVRDLVDMTGGRPESARDMLLEVSAIIDSALNTYARTDDFEVIFDAD